MDHRILNQGRKIELQYYQKSDSGKFEDCQGWCHIRHLWADGQEQADLDGGENVVVVYARNLKDKPTALYQKIDSLATQNVMFPTGSDIEPGKDPPEENAALPECTCDHETYNEVVYKRVPGYYFQPTRKWNDVKCRVCKEEPGNWSTRPSHGNPAFVCTQLELEAVKCTDGVVCPDCYKKQSVEWAAKQDNRRCTRNGGRGNSEKKNSDKE